MPPAARAPPSLELPVELMGLIDGHISGMSHSAPESTRRPSTAASTLDSTVAVTMMRTHSLPHIASLIGPDGSMRQRRSSSPSAFRARQHVARTPPPATKPLRPLVLADKRGAHAMGHGVLVNKSLSRMDISRTAFGCPRWEPARPVERPRARLVMNLPVSPPPSPLRKYRAAAHERPLLPNWMTRQTHSLRVR